VQYTLASHWLMPHDASAASRNEVDQYSHSAWKVAQSMHCSMVVLGVLVLLLVLLFLVFLVRLVVVNVDVRGER
jgi:hypothetical protein